MSYKDSQKRWPLLENGFLLLLSFTLVCITCDGGSGVSASAVLEVLSKDGKISTNAEKTDAETILGIGQGAFIGICVAAGLVILIIPIVCCFCCGCLCFAARKKPQIQAQPSQQQHHQQQPYAKDYPPFNNQPAGPYQQQQQQQQLPRVNSYGQPQFQQHQQQQQQQQQPQQFYNANVQQSNPQYPAPAPYPSGPVPPTPTTPGPASPLAYPDAYNARPEPRHPADPNLVVNRFNSKPGPQVPPKPVQRQRFPGWTNVTKEVKKRNQLKQMQDEADGFEYLNDGYNGGSRSPTP